VRRTAAIAAVAVVAAVVAIALLTRGDDADAQERFVVGSGTTAAVVMRPHDAAPGRPVVLFHHGWTANVPRAYGAWLRHLVDEGADVVFPIYQRRPFDDVRTPLPNVLAAVRAALARLPGHGPLIAAGHSAGGSLSSDYAASAASAGLPRPVAVYAVFPGRDLGPGLFLRGPPLSGIAAGTRLLVSSPPPTASSAPRPRGRSSPERRASKASCARSAIRSSASTTPRWATPRASGARSGPRSTGWYAPRPGSHRTTHQRGQEERPWPTIAASPTWARARWRCRTSPTPTSS
jgi:hypothetical protein